MQKLYLSLFFCVYEWEWEACYYKIKKQLIVCLQSTHNKNSISYYGHTAWGEPCPYAGFASHFCHRKIDSGSFRTPISKIPNTCHCTVLPTSIFCLCAGIICSLPPLHKRHNGELGYSLRLDGGIVRGGNVVGQGDAEATAARWCFRSFSHGSLRKSLIFLIWVRKWQSNVCPNHRLSG